MGYKLLTTRFCTGGRCRVWVLVFFFFLIQLIPLCHQRNVQCRETSRAGSVNENHSPAGIVTFEIKDQRWRWITNLVWVFNPLFLFVSLSFPGKSFCAAWLWLPRHGDRCGSAIGWCCRWFWEGAKENLNCSLGVGAALLLRVVLCRSIPWGLYSTPRCPPVGWADGKHVLHVLLAFPWDPPELEGEGEAPWSSLWLGVLVPVGLCVWGGSGNRIAGNIWAGKKCNSVLRDGPPPCSVKCESGSARGSRPHRGGTGGNCCSALARQKPPHPLSNGPEIRHSPGGFPLLLQLVGKCLWGWLIASKKLVWWREGLTIEHSSDFSAPLSLSLPALPGCKNTWSGDSTQWGWEILTRSFPEHSGFCAAQRITRLAQLHHFPALSPVPEGLRAVLLGAQEPYSAHCAARGQHRAAVSFWASPFEVELALSDNRGLFSSQTPLFQALTRWIQDKSWVQLTDIFFCPVWKVKVGLLSCILKTTPVFIFLYSWFIWKATVERQSSCPGLLVFPLSFINRWVRINVPVQAKVPAQAIQIYLPKNSPISSSWTQHWKLSVCQGKSMPPHVAPALVLHGSLIIYGDDYPFKA